MMLVDDNPAGGAPGSPESPGPAPSSGPSAFQQAAQGIEVPGFGTIAANRRAPRGPLPKFVLPIVGAILVLAVALVYLEFLGGPHSTISTITTTISSGGSSSSGQVLYGCATLTKPGRYVLASATKYQSTKGACITVASDDVGIYCSNNRITGSGPFTNASPFSYGVSVAGRSNVSVVGCAIRNFSYGVFVQSSSGVSVLNNNLTDNYVSDLVLSATNNGSVANNYLAKSSGSAGALYMTNGSTGNRVSNNTVQYNRFYGIRINSTGNRYDSNLLNGSPYSFYCSIGSSSPGSSVASGNSCVNNTGCGFLSCRGVNVPANLSQITLSSDVNQCGSITAPGTYLLSGNLDMGSFTNVSNPAAVYDNIRCITIASSGVILDCRGFAITHGSYAIYSGGAGNVTIENCRISGFDTGITLSHVSKSLISNVTVLNATQYGISLMNTTSVSVQNYTAAGSNLALYMANATSDVVGNPSMRGNQYGAYVASSLGNIFQGGSILNSTSYDVYATLNSANASYNILQGLSCGTTNAQWAGCRVQKTGALAYNPVSSCGTLSQSGNYSLVSNIINAQSNCITISANNVLLNCHSRSITGEPFASGAVVSVHGRSNVTLENCGLYGLHQSVNATDSTSLFMFGMTLANARFGAFLRNVTGGYLEASSISGANNTALYMQRVSYFTAKGLSANYTGSSGVGILIANSSNDVVTGDNGAHNYIGMELTGASKNNMISNNTMSLDSGYDYACYGNSGVNDESGGVNYGTTKLGCKWLAAIPTTAGQLGCQVDQYPDTIGLTSDQQYGYGATCLTIEGNNTAVNCQGHTVIASRGGTFAYFQGVRSASLVNCVLKGFTNPVLASNSVQLTVQNDTISILNSTAGLAGITLLNTQNSRVQGDNVTAPYQGISVIGAGSGTVANDRVSGARYAYQFINASSLTVTNDTALNSQTGISLVGSDQNTFQANNATLGVTAGLSCDSGSQSNFDNGGNLCVGLSGCPWISLSKATCRS